jgi:PncC family amidohydrolase
MAEPLEVTVGKLLERRAWHLAVAESCTGGLIAHTLTNVSGSSAYFLGSMTTYANEAKQRLLGVHSDTLERHGAVSRETASEMAQGVRQAFGAEVGLSVSGIAGPSGGTPEKPIGTVWIGLSAENVLRAQHFHFQGDRLQVKQQAAQKALELLVTYLRD